MCAVRTTTKELVLLGLGVIKFFFFHKFVYHLSRVAHRLRGVRGSTSWVRKSYAYGPVRCKTARRTEETVRAAGA